MNNISLFEISWEVSNKVGGIHTVLASKINYAKEYAKNYITFGPYKNQEEFESQEIPQHLTPVFQDCENLGIKLHYGKWHAHEKEAQCILVELKGFEQEANNIKSELWNHFQIDSLNSSWYDFDEVMAWSWACGIVCKKLATIFNDTKSIVHAHEWMSAGAVFFIEAEKKKYFNNENLQNIKTVFTTHATMLGRAYYGHNNSVLTKEILNEKTPLEIAKDLGVHTKYLTEYKAFRVANVSACVSDLLKQEIEDLYDYFECQVTENGFEIELSFDDCIHQFSDKHSTLTHEIQKYFKPFSIIKKNMRIGIISGRYEIAAKGYDASFKALGELNEELKKVDIQKEIVILATIIAGNYKKVETDLPTDSFALSVAPLSQYDIDMDHPIMQLCFKNGLMNRKEDKVKIIVVPNLISKDHKVFGLDYYDILQACDFSLYPSGYEPWGYTPHESIALGVTTLSSEFAGFGKYWINAGINNSVVNSIKSQVFDYRVSQIKEFIKEEYHKLANTQYREKKYALEYSKELQWKLLFENYKNIYQG